MKRFVDRAIETVARARAPKEPPVPAGPKIASSGVLERPTCPLCKNTRAKTVMKARDTWIQDGPAVKGAPDEYTVVRCEICSHRYTTPRFTLEHKAKAFEGAYPFYNRARRARTDKVNEDLDLARAPFIPRADGLSGVMPLPGRLLDIGCGDGLFMDVMQSRGWSVQGLDVSEDVVWHAKEVLGLKCGVADVESEALPQGPFDAVTLWGVLQLIYAPRDLLDRVYQALEPGGVVGIGVSNISSAGAQMFRGQWRGLGLPRHISHFTPETLGRLLEWAGFEVLERRFASPKWVIAGSIDDTPHLPGPARKIAKAALYAASKAYGGTSYGDTLEIYARRPRA